MTDEEIRKIAVAYSVSRPVDEMPTNTSMARMIVADALRWLSKDYCIVPKEQIHMRHGAALFLMEQDPARREFYRGRSSVIESIFGKDMFEEEEGK